MSLLAGEPEGAGASSAPKGEEPQEGTEAASTTASSSEETVSPGKSSLLEKAKKKAQDLATKYSRN